MAARGSENSSMGILFPIKEEGKGKGKEGAGGAAGFHLVQIWSCAATVAPSVGRIPQAASETAKLGRSASAACIVQISSHPGRAGWTLRRGIFVRCTSFMGNGDDKVCKYDT